MSWEEIVKRERTEISTLVDEISDLTIELTLLVNIVKETEANKIFHQINKLLMEIVKKEKLQ